MPAFRITSAVICCVAVLMLPSRTSGQYSDQLCVTPLNDTHNQQQPCFSNYDQCKDLVSLSTSKYTYDGDIQPVNITLKTAAKEPLFYYKLCSRVANTADVRLVQCVKGNKTVYTDVYWNVTGLNELSVQVYNDSQYSNFVDCSVKNVLVANNTGLSLSVTVTQHTKDIAPSKVYNPATDAPIGPAHPITPTCSPSKHLSVYQVGNITFMSSVNLTNYTRAHFKYDFGDGQYKEVDNISTVANYYRTEGHYQYKVDAFVVLKDDEVAVHKERRNRIRVLERVINPAITVGNDDSVQLGVVTDVHVTVSGSFPIRFCWCMVMPNSSSCVSVPAVNQTSRNNITCQRLSSTNVAPVTFTQKMNFTMTGVHKIWANFSNLVDCHNKSFSFYVYIPNPDAIIVSTTTVGVLAALLVIAIIVIIVIVTVIIPYRRYKTKMTETANFRFIELSESTATVKGKMKRGVNNFRNYFRSNSEARVGLVNTDRSDLEESEPLLNHDRVVKFAPYDSL